MEAKTDPRPWRVLVTGGSGFIGTHLVARLLARPSTTVANLDVAAPHRADQMSHWRRGDVRDGDAVGDVMADVEPTHVVHLAAETTTPPDAGLGDYPTNIDGTRNVLRGVATTPTVHRYIHTSTQFVCRPGKVPGSDTDVDPHTVYGRSKVAGEELCRQADLGDVAVTIVRPTTIWGPFDLGYRATFHRLMRRGWYVHPNVGPVPRSYGYVGNVAWQVERILELPARDVDGAVLYLGDRPIDVREWADAFSRAWHGRPARTVPQGLVRLLARIGEQLARRDLPTPIHQSRYDSLTTPYPVPIERTFELLGEPPYDLESGVAQTVAWYDQHVGGRR